MNSKTMRAAAIDHYGDPDQITMHEIPVPEPGPDQVLFRVHTAGVGVWGPMIRTGKMEEIMEGTPSFPYVLGSDGAGTVVAVGENVFRFREGDSVWAVAYLNESGGFFAEYGLVRQDYVAPLPEGLPPEQAGALGVDVMTAFRGLRDALSLRPDETIAVFGASGGVGHLAVQLAKRMGARVLAIASGDDGVALVEELGADAAVDGKAGDVGEAAQAFAPDGLDAALVLSSGNGLDAVLQAVRKGGRVAFPHGVEEPEVPSGVEQHMYNGDPDREGLDAVNELIQAGPFRVHIARTFALDEVPEAHRALDEHFIGKLAVTVGS